MKKAVKRPRPLIRHAQPMGPTPEREAKSAWSGKDPKRVLTTVQALLNAGDITQDAANAAERWYRDYVFGHCDYIEFGADHVADTTTRHDAVSWQVTRANAWGRIVDVRQALGVCAHQRLRMMLVDEMTFNQMGRALFPGIAESSGRRKIGAQCTFILEQLCEHYKASRKQKEKPCPRARVWYQFNHNRIITPFQPPQSGFSFARKFSMPIKRGDVVQFARYRGVCVGIVGKEALMCPIVQSDDLWHRADMPVDWLDCVMAGLTTAMRVRCWPVLVRNHKLCVAGEVSSGCLSRVEKRVRKERDMRALEEKWRPVELPEFGERPLLASGTDA